MVCGFNMGMRHEEIVLCRSISYDACENELLFETVCAVRLRQMLLCT